MRWRELGTGAPGTVSVSMVGSTFLIRPIGAETPSTLPRTPCNTLGGIFDARKHLQHFRSAARETRRMGFGDHGMCFSKEDVTLVGPASQAISKGVKVPRRGDIGTRGPLYVVLFVVSVAFLVLFVVSVVILVLSDSFCAYRFSVVLF